MVNGNWGRVTAPLIVKKLARKTTNAINVIFVSVVKKNPLGQLLKQFTKFDQLFGPVM